jgi:hypothetical protein
MLRMIEGMAQNGRFRGLAEPARAARPVMSR